MNEDQKVPTPGDIFIGGVIFIVLLCVCVASVMGVIALGLRLF